MAKQNKKQKSSKEKILITTPTPPPLSPTSLSFLSGKSNQLIIVIVLACALYANTLSNQFALDDGMVLSANKLVLKGVSAIPDILAHDSFYGSIGDTKNLTGGRYRPLSLVSYAMEVSFFGNNPLVHHLLNVLFYALTGVVLLNFLRRFIFPLQPIAAFITTLLFIFHPAHTEVVANIKSRDEIFSLLFLILTLHYLLLYLKESKRSQHILLAIIFYFLALLSKENGLIFVAIIPLTIYFFTEKKFTRIVSGSFPFIAVAAFYVIIRISLLGFRNNMVAEVMDNPYVLATASQKVGTILFVFLKYLKLLFLPYPLTYDYSYRQIPYRDFSDPLVWFSFLIYTSLAVHAFIRLKKKDILGWCIIFFFGSLFLVSNLFFNIGAPMAERFLYQASVPFLIAIVESVRRVLIHFKISRAVTVSFVSVPLTLIFISSSYIIIARNQDWKSDDTLFLHDVKISTNSARANTYAGVAFVRLSDEAKDSVIIKQDALLALNYFRKSLSIKADYVPTLLNMGTAYSRLDYVDSAEAVWNRARALEPNSQYLKQNDEYLFQTFFKRGLEEGAQKNFTAAVTDLEKAVKYKPANANAWYNLGGAYFSVKNFEKAKTAWEKALSLNPKLTQAQEGLDAIRHLPGRTLE